MGWLLIEADLELDGSGSVYIGTSEGAAIVTYPIEVYQLMAK